MGTLIGSSRPRRRAFPYPIYNRACRVIGYRPPAPVLAASSRGYELPRPRTFLQPISQAADARLRLLLMREGRGRGDWRWAPLEAAHRHLRRHRRNQALYDEIIEAVLPDEFRGVPSDWRVVTHEGLRASAVARRRGRGVSPRARKRSLHNCAILVYSFRPLSSSPHESILFSIISWTREEGGETTSKNGEPPQNERVEKLDKKIEALKARRQRYLALEKEKARRADTRRKIVLGGTVIALLAEGEELGRRLLNVARERATESDRPLLDWENEG